MVHILILHLHHVFHFVNDFTSTKGYGRKELIFERDDFVLRRDRFLITKEELVSGEEVATCPSCSLLLKVIYDPDQFQSTESEEIIVVTHPKTAVNV
ncbi:unnamed protein product [Allacma fusca]|uniref:DPH-type MB domain-containing protein n=1 Tax=Allacma fusca TaxID=39272 RepID=A0A8J2JKA1_9HEXA|nr:unnamed protein product [Allacma fusca]